MQILILLALTASIPTAFAAHPCYEDVALKDKNEQVSYPVKTEFTRVQNHIMHKISFLNANIIEEWDYVPNPGQLINKKKYFKNGSNIIDFSQKLNSSMNLSRHLTEGDTTFGRCLTAEFVNDQGDVSAIWIRDDGKNDIFWTHKSEDKQTPAGVSRVFHYRGEMFFIGADDACAKAESHDYEECFNKFIRTDGVTKTIIGVAMYRNGQYIVDSLDFKDGQFYMDNRNAYPLNAEEKYTILPRGRVKYDVDSGKWGYQNTRF